MHHGICSERKNWRQTQVECQKLLLFSEFFFLRCFDNEDIREILQRLNSVKLYSFRNHRIDKRLTIINLRTFRYRYTEKPALYPLFLFMSFVKGYISGRLKST